MMKEHPRFKGYYATKEGQFYSNKGAKGTIREIFPVKINTGYYILHCHYPERKYQVPAHRFLAEIYLPNPNNLSDVNHKDLNKGNNCVSNLEWLSHKDNTIHGRVRMGKRFMVENVKNGEKYEIRNLLKWCEDIGINRTSAYNVLNGKQQTVKNRTYKLTRMGR